MTPGSPGTEEGTQPPPPPPPHDGPPAPPYHEGPPSGFPFGGPPHHGHHGHHEHSHGGPRGGFGGGRGRHGGRRGGGCGGFRRGGWPFGGPQNFDMGDMNPIAQFFGQHFGEGAGPTKPEEGGKDFTPPADVFDTEDAYIVHISLAGAKKEDVGVNWDADKSELSIAGVIYRPGDEDFLKTLAMDERKIGVFERKVRLGSRAAPAQVESDGITAKMEDGVLMITIPKLDKDFVEIKKVDIE